MNTRDPDRKTIETKHQDLERSLRQMGRVMVAFSGGGGQHAPLESVH